MTEKRLCLITPVNGDNDYDGYAYAYIEITQDGLDRIKTVLSNFDTASKELGLNSGTFYVPDGVDCWFLTSLPDDFDLEAELRR